MDITIIPGADRPAIPTLDFRRTWLKRRAALSALAVDLLLERALGELPAGAIEWPVPTWAGAPLEGHAHG